MRKLGAFLIAMAAAIGLSPVHASLPNPDEPMAIPVDAKGQGEALPFDAFNMKMFTLSNIADPKLLDGKMNRDRLKVLARVNAVADPRSLSPDQAAIYAVDCLRLGNGDGLYLNKAVDLLAGHSRDRRRPSYFVHTTLAALHVARGFYQEAIAQQDEAILDCEMPAKVAGWSDAQRNWIAGLDRDYLPVYLRIRRAEADPATRPASETEEPTPLFPLTRKNPTVGPVRFVNEAGKYEPGVLAKAERDKLPADAIAIVQQLLLWFPTDSRLYWLLAELYAADGNFPAAQTIFTQCTWDRKFTRRILLEHRSAVAAANEANAKKKADAANSASAAAPAEPEETSPINLQALGIYFGAVMLIAAIALVRSVTKRGKPGGGMNCCQ